uniref:Uncharacterized protein n=1 Tax=Sichuan mosquito tombus-like virus TaxID=2864009 RepID=A0A8K1HKG2_9TOMB|nr:hypothetical protein 2 [Sichuan mosquito tombus-like virus]
MSRTGCKRVSTVPYRKERLSRFSEHYGNTIQGNGMMKGLTFYHSSLSPSTKRLLDSWPSTSFQHKATKPVTGNGQPVSCPLRPGHTGKPLPLAKELTETPTGGKYRTKKQMPCLPGSDHPGKSTSQHPVKPQNGRTKPSVHRKMGTKSRSSSRTKEERKGCQLSKILKVSKNQRAEVAICNTTPADLVVGLYSPLVQSLKEPEAFGRVQGPTLGKLCLSCMEEKSMNGLTGVAVLKPNQKFECTIEVTDMEWVEIWVHHFSAPIVHVTNPNRDCKTIGTQCGPVVTKDTECQTISKKFATTGTQVEPGDTYTPVGATVAPSLAHQNANWEIVTSKDGSRSCKLVCDTNLKPSYAGPTARYALYTDGHDLNDRRPFKVIELFDPKKHKIDIRMVDYELYWHLKRHILFKPFDKNTLLNLRIEAKKFFDQFKNTHIDIALVCNITESTILAVCIPAEKSLKRVQCYLDVAAAKRNAKYASVVDEGKPAKRWYQFGAAPPLFKNA